MPDLPIEQRRGSYRDWLERDKAQHKEASVIDRASDLGIDMLQGAIALPEAFVGLADIPTGGRFGKLLEEKVGYKPAEAKQILSDLYSEERKFEQSEVSKAFDEQGFFGGLAEAAVNPSVVGGQIVQAAPQMLAGGAIGRGIGALSKVPGWMAAGAGEGLMGAGSAAEQIRGETEDGLLTGEQSMYAAGSGLFTAGLGALGSKVAGRLGLADIDTLAGAVPELGEQVGKTTVGRTIIGSALSEGVLEELPQSAQEQIMQNLALGKEPFEGISEAMGMGLVTGTAMGAGMGGTSYLNDQMAAAVQNGARVKNDLSEEGRVIKEGIDEQTKIDKSEGRLAVSLQDDAPTLDELDRIDRDAHDKLRTDIETREQQQEVDQEVDSEVVGLAEEAVTEKVIEKATGILSHAQRASGTLGIDPVTFQGYAEAIFEENQTPAAFRKAMVAQFGDGVKPHIQQLHNQLRQNVRFETEAGLEVKTRKDDADYQTGQPISAEPTGKEQPPVPFDEEAEAAIEEVSPIEMSEDDRRQFHEDVFRQIKDAQRDTTEVVDVDGNVESNYQHKVIDTSSLDPDTKIIPSRKSFDEQGQVAKAEGIALSRIKREKTAEDRRFGKVRNFRQVVRGINKGIKLKQKGKTIKNLEAALDENRANAKKAVVEFRNSEAIGRDYDLYNRRRAAGSIGNDTVSQVEAFSNIMFRLSSEYVIDDVVEFIKQEEGVSSLSELEGIPSSLLDLYAYTADKRQAFVEERDEMDNLLSEDGKAVEIAILQDLSKRLEEHPEEIEANRGFLLKFVKRPQEMLQEFNRVVTTDGDVAGIISDIRKKFKVKVTPFVAEYFVRLSRQMAAKFRSYQELSEEKAVEPSPAAGKVERLVDDSTSKVKTQKREEPPRKTVEQVIQGMKDTYVSFANRRALRSQIIIDNLSPFYVSIRNLEEGTVLDDSYQQIANGMANHIRMLTQKNAGQESFMKASPEQRLNIVVALIDNSTVDNPFVGTNLPKSVQIVEAVETFTKEVSDFLYEKAMSITVEDGKPSAEDHIRAFNKVKSYVEGLKKLDRKNLTSKLRSEFALDTRLKEDEFGWMNKSDIDFILGEVASRLVGKGRDVGEGTIGVAEQIDHNRGSMYTYSPEDYVEFQYGKETIGVGGTETIMAPVDPETGKRVVGWNNPKAHSRNVALARRQVLSRHFADPKHLDAIIEVYPDVQRLAVTYTDTNGQKQTKIIPHWELPTLRQRFGEVDVDDITKAFLYDRYIQTGGADSFYVNIRNENQAARDMKYELVLKDVQDPDLAYEDKVGSIYEYVSSQLTRPEALGYESWKNERGNVEKFGQDLIAKFERLESAEKRLFGHLYHGDKSNTSEATIQDTDGLEVKAIHTSVAKTKLDPFEKELASGRPIPGTDKVGNPIQIVKLKSKIAQKFYDLVAQQFDADLVVVSDEKYKSRYIGKASDGRAKIVVNVQSSTPFHRLYAHELFHHLANRMSRNDYRMFSDAVRSVVNEPLWSRAVMDIREAQAVPLDSDDSYQAIAQEELLAEVFSHAVTQVGFYKSLAGNMYGRLLASKTILKLMDQLNGHFNILQSGDMMIYENREFVSQDGMGQLYWLISDMLGGSKQRAEELRHANTRYDTTAALESIAGVADKGKAKLTGFWRSIFPEGTKSYKDVMTNLETLMSNAVQWVAKNKYAGMYAHWMADKKQLTAMHKMYHTANQRVSEVQSRYLSKHKGAFDQLSEKDMMKLHDDFVRRVKRVRDPQNPTEWVTARMPDLDLSGDNKTSRGQIEWLKNRGWSDEIIEAFRDLDIVGKQVLADLKKVQPDIEVRSNHFAQSIKWYGKGGIDLNPAFDWVIDPEHSKLEGDKRFLKQKDTSRTTQEISNFLEAQELHPLRMASRYVRDAYRFVYFKQFMDESLKNETARVFEDQYRAADAGYAPVSDNATKIMKKMGITYGFKLQNEDGSFITKDGQDLLFTNEKEAKIFKSQYAKAATVVNASSDKVMSADVYNVMQGDRVIMSFPTAEAASAKVNELNQQQSVEAGYDASTMIYTMQPGQVDRGVADIGRIYFKEDTAKLLNTILSEDQIRKRKAGRLVMTMKNLQTSWEFAFSLFHFMTIGQELMASNASHSAALAKQKGKKTFSAWLKGFDPGFSRRRGGAWRDADKIAALLIAAEENPSLAQEQAFKDELASLLGNEVDGGAADILTQFYQAGGRMHQDPELRSIAHYDGEMRWSQEGEGVSVKDGIIDYGYVPRQVVKSAMDSYKKVWSDQVAKENSKVMAAFKFTRFAALQSTTSWLMEYTIPRAKMAMWAKEYSLKVSKQQDAIARGDISKEDIARDTMRFIEDRFGEVNWENQWMKPTIKTTLQFLFRSYTWFTGSWTALAKAGLDIGRLGWFKLKGQDYELTEKGMWAFSAVAAHLMTVGLITAIYSVVAGAGGEEPTDEETPILTRLLFPRIDPSDPESRLSVPSYITEFYKIAAHLGLLNTEAEFHKLISGRVNSLTSNLIEAVSNEDWRGVAIRDRNDNAIEQFWDTAYHIAGASPISISTMADEFQRKGLTEMVPLAILGFTGAPAAAKRTKATNLAFHIRRQEYKGREILPEDMELKEDIKKAIYQYAEGDRTLLNKLRKEKKVTQRQIDMALTRVPRIKGRPNPRYKDPLSQAIKGLTIDGALDVWVEMTETEKKRHKPEIYKKYLNMRSRKDKPGVKKKEIRDRMKELGIIR